MFPQSLFAAEDITQKQDHKLVHVIADVEVYSPEGEQLGQLYKDTYLFTSSQSSFETEGKTTLHWGEEEAIVNSASLVEEEVVENLPKYNSFDEMLSNEGKLTALEEPILFIDENGVVSGSIAPGKQLSVSKLDQEYFYILVGGKEFIVQREQYEKNFTKSEVEDLEVVEELDQTEGNSSSGSVETETDDAKEQQLEEETNFENAEAEVETSTENDDQQSTTTTSADSHEKLTSETASSEKAKAASTSNVQTFSKETKYFKVTADQVPVYDNRSSSLVIVGYLKKGQVYPRTQDYTSWHQITFGDYYAYVPKEGTIPSEPLIQNEYKMTSLGKSARTFTALTNVEVYDNSSGDLIPYASIKEGVEHTIIKEYTSWYSVLVSGRLGFVRKSEVSTSFLQTDKFFEVTEDRVPVYDNSSGDLVEVGYLEQGESYPRIKHYTSWHAVKFGHVTGYVRSSSTTPNDGKTITNLGNGKATSTTIRPRWDSVVYDNTQNSKLVPFAVVKSNTTYKVVKEYTSWYSIEVAGRIGYINKSNAVKQFSETAQYFKALNSSIPVYDNRSGTLVKVGTLTEGQVYPRTADFTSWHEIQFGNFKAYVPKDGTEPASASSIQNLNTNYKNLKKTFIALKNLDVMDNTTPKLSKFGEIEEGQTYPIISESTNWWGILFADRIGYVKKDYALGGIYKEVTYTSYDYTLDSMVDKQMKVNPQTDKYRIQYAYLASYLVSPDSNTFPTNATVTGTYGVNLRSEPTTNGSWVYNNVEKGKTLKVVADVGNGWYKVEYPTHIFGGFSAAYESDVRKYVDPANFDLTTKSMYQFVLLSKFAGANPSELNNLLDGKGILEGKGEAFSQGSKLAGINEIYLVSHALLETGNGSSPLATGVNYKAPDGKTYKVYNMFGINANDGNATANASKFAYEEGWFTPEAAIIGGAKFVADRYVYNGYGQDTIYEMRWNPASPATHQYATDVGWAEKQTTNFMNMYNKLTSYQLYLDIPKYQ